MDTVEEKFLRFQVNLITKRDEVTADIKANEGKTLVVNNYVIIRLTLDYVIAALASKTEFRGAPIALRLKRISGMIGKLVAQSRQ